MRTHRKENLEAAGIAVKLHLELVARGGQGLGSRQAGGSSEEKSAHLVAAIEELHRSRKDEHRNAATHYNHNKILADGQAMPGWSKKQQECLRSAAVYFEVKFTQVTKSKREYSQ